MCIRDSCIVNLSGNVVQAIVLGRAPVSLSLVVLLFKAKYSSNFENVFAYLSCLNLIKKIVCPTVVFCPTCEDPVLVVTKAASPLSPPLKV